MTAARLSDGRAGGGGDFGGLLFPHAATEDASSIDGDRTFASDLNIDQIVAAVVAGREEPDYLTALWYTPLHDLEVVRYRQEVFSDLEDPELFGAVEAFGARMVTVRSHLRQLEKMEERYQREGWQLDAASIYCTAVRSLADDLAPMHLASRALSAFKSYLAEYASSVAFCTLEADTAERKHELGEIRYCTRIRGTKVEVSRYNDEPDYSAAVLRTFERFRQGAVAEYRATYRTWPGINHVTARILTLVAKLFSDEFAALDEYCKRHAAFFDAGIRRFERELQFYLSYLDYLAPMRSRALPFCLPDVGDDSLEMFANETFDLALAAKLVPEDADVVPNDFSLRAPERIIVVTGPNQGGKSTFARLFGQVHYLAALGCPVPGTSARLALFDRLFTQFEREEDLARMSGKLEDDIVRARDILESSTSRSIIILNEVFSSTTLQDARFLGTKLVKKIIEIGALCVYVTFVDELSRLGESVVSMMSTVVPEDPAQRTFKVVRRDADGLAYALAIAEKHHVTYERLRERLVS